MGGLSAANSPRLPVFLTGPTRLGPASHLPLLSHLRLIDLCNCSPTGADEDLAGLAQGEETSPSSSLLLSSLELGDTKVYAP